MTKVAAGFLMGNWSISKNLEKQNGQRIIPIAIFLFTVTETVYSVQNCLPYTVSVSVHCQRSLL